MIDYDVSLTGDTEIGVLLQGFPDNIKRAVARKLRYRVDKLYEKVVENVSGKLLQKKTGELAASIQKSFSEAGDTMVGQVYVDPVTPKAIVHEQGGKGYYAIFPDKASVLRFIGKAGDVVFAAYVNHPPAMPKHYLASALEDMLSGPDANFNDILDDIEAVWKGA